MRWWVIGLAVLSTSSITLAQERCGSARIADGNLRLFVIAHQKDPAPAEINYVQVEAFSPDEAFSVSVHYAAGPTLGPPTRFELHAYFDLPDATRASPERMTWRIADEAWNPPQYWSTPSRQYGDPAKTQGYVSFPVAQSGRFPSRTDQLDRLGRGDIYELRRVSREGAELASGVVAYPDEKALRPLYDRARQRALASLGACGAPVMIPQAK